MPTRANPQKRSADRVELGMVFGGSYESAQPAAPGNCLLTKTSPERLVEIAGSGAQSVFEAEGGMSFDDATARRCERGVWIFTAVDPDEASIGLDGAFLDA